MTYNTYVTTLSFHDYFFLKFREWEEHQPGKRSTYTAFALWLSDNSLGVELKQQLVNDWIRGKYKPSDDKYLLVLEEKLGREIYDVLNVKRPNPFLQSINSRWDRIPPDKQAQLAKDAAHYEAEALKNGSKSTPKSRKTAPR